MTILEEQSDGIIVDEEDTTTYYGRNNQTLMNESVNEVDHPFSVDGSSERIPTNIASGTEMVLRNNGGVVLTQDASFLNDILSQRCVENVGIPTMMHSSSPMLNPQIPEIDFMQKLTANENINSV